MTVTESACFEAAGFLEPPEAKRLSEALKQGQPVSLAVDVIRGDRQKATKDLLQRIDTEVGGNTTLSTAVLAAIAKAGERAEQLPEIVWSGPTTKNAKGRSTRAVAADLIGMAEKFVYVATYSGTSKSPYVKALRKAIERDVHVVVIVDSEHQSKTAEMLHEALPDAAVYSLKPRTDEKYAAMHSKFVVIDDRAAFITSANFSTAAADRNLETGVILYDASIARQVRGHIDALRNEGVVVEYRPGS